MTLEEIRDVSSDLLLLLGKLIYRDWTYLLLLAINGLSTLVRLLRVLD